MCPEQVLLLEPALWRPGPSLEALQLLHNLPKDCKHPRDRPASMQSYRETWPGRRARDRACPGKVTLEQKEVTGVGWLVQRPWGGGCTGSQRGKGGVTPGPYGFLGCRVHHRGALPPAQGKQAAAAASPTSLQEVDWMLQGPL